LPHRIKPPTRTTKYNKKYNASIGFLLPPFPKENNHKPTKK
jgi:hypothetical protein